MEAILSNSEILRPDWQQAHTFFNIIRPVELCTFQTFDDSADKRPSLVRVLHGAGHGRELAQLNAAGGGVFVAVNPMRPGGRSNAHLIENNTVMADFDEGAPARVPVEPTVRVQTSICPETDIVKEQWWWRLGAGETLTHEQQRAIMHCLIENYGSDPNAKDAARVGRLPGFWHRKREPQMVRVIGGTGKPVHAADMIEKFRPPPEPPRPRVTRPSFYHGDRYVVGTTRRLVLELSQAQEGYRNPTLNWAAFRLAQIGMPDIDIEAALLPVAIGVGLGEREARRTIASGIAGASRQRAA
jgi:hypothetical protein